MLIGSEGRLFLLSSVLVGTLFLAPPCCVSAQTVSDSQHVFYEIEGLIKANSFVVTGVDFNSDGYPFDGVSPKLSYYSDPNTRQLRKLTAYKAYSMVSERLEVFFNHNGERVFIFFKRVLTTTETHPALKNQVSETVLSEYRIYTFGKSVLKAVETYADDAGRLRTRDVLRSEISEIQRILGSAERKVGFYNELEDFSREL